MALNQVYQYGRKFAVPTASITAPAAPESGDAVLVNQLPAVAQTDPLVGADGVSRVSIQTDGVWDLPVNANAGAIAVGHIVHIATADGALSNTAAGGVRFGYALAAVANAATTIIPVKLGY
ncbi:DUF2190 family protein [Glycomyces sp. NPDC021274]|uniref:DUF2190 family protein n=1 Tax=Glycomyces sp. NPDC021274 TaxID=3155120 RepID=UPI0033DDF3E6